MLLHTNQPIVLLLLYFYISFSIISLILDHLQYSAYYTELIETIQFLMPTTNERQLSTDTNCLSSDEEILKNLIEGVTACDSKLKETSEVWKVSLETLLLSLICWLVYLNIESSRRANAIRTRNGKGNSGIKFATRKEFFGALQFRK